MKTQLTTLFLLSFLAMTSLFSQNSLKIVNTNWWGDIGEEGTIEEAMIAIRPQGAYMEIELFLTMSAQGLGYGGFDELEIVLDFTLPSGAIIHDSWLWLPDGTTIVKADVYDIRSATNIYDEIVDRASDPSILYRKEGGGYQLRVFPLDGEGSRKVKISYLTPAVWSENFVETWLPTQLFSHSLLPLSSAKIITIPDPLWETPTLTGYGNIDFESYNDPIYGAVLGVNIPNEFFNMPMKFTVDAPFDADGVFAGYREEGDDHFYQVAYIPPYVVHQVTPRNIVVLFDHDEDNAHVNKLGLFEHVKDVLRDNLNEQDKFNLLFSNSGGNQFLSDTWISGEAMELNTALSQLSDPIKNFPNLIPLLLDGITFIKNNGGEGDIVLIANSNHESFWNMENLTNQVLTLIGQDDIRINIVNYQDLNFYYDWWWDEQNDIDYQHRELYENLTFGTSGTFYSIFGGAFNVWESISSAFSDLYRENYFFDFNTELASGFTYHKFNQNYLGQSENPNKPIIQMGKYFGDLPMTLNFMGASDGGLIAETKTLSEGDFFASDTLLRESWTGHYIKHLEGEASNNSDALEVINISKFERVLSKYTAFLALDIENGGEPCLDCWEYTEILIATDDLSEKEAFEIILEATPNPCSDGCRINFEYSGDYNGEVIVAEIFDAFGQLITTIDTRILEDLGKMEWFWGATDYNGRAVPDGIYFLTIKSQAGVQTLKLMVVK